MVAEPPSGAPEDAAWAELELWCGFYVRAGRSRSNRPPETSASADAEPVRAQVTVSLALFMKWTLSEFVRHRKAPRRKVHRGRVA